MKRVFENNPWDWRMHGYEGELLCPYSHDPNEHGHEPGEVFPVIDTSIINSEVNRLMKMHDFMEKVVLGEIKQLSPVKCPLVDAVSVYREREANDRQRINQAIAIEAKEALKRKDWDAANWSRYQTVLEGE